MRITKKHFLSFIILFSAAQFMLAQNFTFTETKAAGLIDQQEGFRSGGDIQKAFGQTGAPRDIRLITAKIIKVFLGVLGIIFVALLVAAGYKWMTAVGNEDKIKEAKGQITTAVIGLLIILAAYSITDFVINQIRKATTGDIW